MTFYMSDILRMFPLLKVYSHILEEKTLRSQEIAKELEPLESKGRTATLEEACRMRALNIELDALLESLYSLAAELKEDFNINICDPTTGSLDIPCWGCTERVLTFICYDHTCERDSSKLRCHPTIFGEKEERTEPWTIT